KAHTHTHTQAHTHTHTITQEHTHTHTHTHTQNNTTHQPPTTHHTTHTHTHTHKDTRSNSIDTAKLQAHQLKMTREEAQHAKAAPFMPDCQNKDVSVTWAFIVSHYPISNKHFACNIIETT